MINRILALCCLLLVISGCSSTPPTSQYYLLPQPTASEQVTDDAPALEVRVELAQHLNQAGIAYRSNEAQLVNTRQHRWAQALSQQLDQQFVLNLRQQQQPYWPIAATPAVASNQKTQLLIRFTRFNGAYTGNAELSGEWMLINAKGTLLNNKSFSVEVPSESEGYPALINALSQGVEKLSKSIASAL